MHLRYARGVCRSVIREDLLKPLDNSLRYGSPGLTRIRVHAMSGTDGLTVVYEDDGTGIADAEKEKIFSETSGKTGGHGLFLVREILAITRITIRETGDAGKGARFELLVPREMYRGNPSDPTN